MAFYSYVPYTYGGPNGSTITLNPGSVETSELAVLGDTRYIWSDGALPDQDPRIGLKKLTKIQLPDAAASAYASMPTLDDQKAAKAEQVNSAFAKLQAYNCPSCYVTSSLGFAINADACSANNIQSLIDMLPNDTTTTIFKVYDNTFKTLAKPALKTLLSECKQNGLSLYQQKFALLSKIQAAASKADLDAIAITFSMADYSAASEA